MKILNITDLANGGLATYLEMIYNKQSEKNIVYILASQNLSEERITNLKGFLSLDPYSRSLKGLVHGYKISRKYMIDLQPDIVYIHSSFAGVFARLATLGLRNKPKIIYCSHGWAFLMQGNPLKKFIFKWVEKLFSYLTDAIITISHNEYKAAISAGITPKKLYQIKHGISPVRQLIDDSFSQINTFQKNKVNILFIGRYDYSKGFDWLMNFIENHSIENICWHIAGKSIIDEPSDIPKNIINHGWVDYKVIPQLIMHSDVIIMPSRWEAFGLSVIEAMKYAKPVIASDNGALPELIQHKKNGWLFNLDQPNELLNILQSLTSHKIKKFGEKGYMLFTKNYTDDKMIEKLDILMSKFLLKGNK